MEAVGQEQLFIAQELLPVYSSVTEVGRYPRFRKKAAELLRAGRNPNGDGTFQSNTKRGATGTYQELTRKFEWDSYQTEEYGLEERVDDVVARRMENFFDAQMVTGKFVMNELMLDYEMEVSLKLNTTIGTDANEGLVSTNVATAWTGANLATMDVPAEMNAVIERLTLLGELPEEAVMSLSVWNLIRRSQKLQTYVYGFLNVTQGGSQITEQMFAACFGLKRLIVAKKSVDVSTKGTATNLIPVWGNTNVLVGRFGEGDFMNGGLGRTIVWDADSPGGLFTSEEYRDERRRGSMLRIRSNRALKMINPVCGQLVAISYAP
jgi:hypothetical protein